MEKATTVLSSSNGLSFEAFLSTILYTTMGIVMLVLAVVIINRVFGMRVRQELVKDNNVAVGVVVAGLAVAIAIIISGTISS